MATIISVRLQCHSCPKRSRIVHVFQHGQACVEKAIHTARSLAKKSGWTRKRIASRNLKPHDHATPRTVDHCPDCS